jgi:hypothetical protein
MLLFLLYRQGQSRVDNRPITETQEQYLRVEPGVDAGEKLLLRVGKPGSVKRRVPLATDLQEIFSRSMPDLCVAKIFAKESTRSNYLYALREDSSRSQV